LPDQERIEHQRQSIQPRSMGHKERLDAWFVGKQASIQALVA
jgi:hypothetical protein